MELKKRVKKELGGWGGGATTKETFSENKGAEGHREEIQSYKKRAR